MSSFDLHPKLFLTNGTIKTTGTSANLTAGELGLYSPFTHQVVTVANAATHPAAYIAQGSYSASDKLGNNHGGFKESIKSPAFTKGINPKMVKRFYKVLPQTPQTQSVRLFWNGTTAAAGPQFLCGKTYYMRLEVKGEPVLRFINRYLYKHLGAYTGCCGNDCTAPCTPEVVDAATVLYQYAVGINGDPLLSNFLSARVISKVAGATLTTNGTTAATVDVATGIVVGQRIVAAGVPYGTTVAAITGLNVTLSVAATASAAVPATFNQVITSSYVSPVLAADKALVVAGLEIDVNYSDTVFADSSFNQADYVDDKFIEVLASMVYQNGDVCEGGEVVMNHTTGVGFTEITPFRTSGGSGEFILREFIASQLSSGIFFSHVPREREVSGNVALSAVDRSAYYTRYYLQYSVAQTGNPSNTLSQDQYMLCFAFKTGVSATAFETLFLAWLQEHNPTLVLETVA